MLALLLATLLCQAAPAKPLPDELQPPDYDAAEALEDADIIAALVARAAQEQRDAEAAWKINELLDTLTMQP